MTDLEAIETIECKENPTEEEYIEAVQSLIDSGVIWHLQGSYQRLAHNLIDAGVCANP